MRLAEGYRNKVSFVTLEEYAIRHCLDLGDIWGLRTILHRHCYDPLATSLDRFEDAELESTMKGALG